MANLGISFSPFSEDKGGNANPRGPQVSPQEAIRTLSLRVPRTVGAGSPIPQMLLNAPGGASFGGAQAPSAPGAAPRPGTPNMGLEELLAMLFGRKPSMQQGLSLPIDQSPGGGNSGGTFPPMQVPAPAPQPGPWQEPSYQPEPPYQPQPPYQPAPPPQPGPPPPRVTPIEPPAPAPEPMPWDQPSSQPFATSRGGFDLSERRRV